MSGAMSERSFDVAHGFAAQQYQILSSPRARRTKQTSSSRVPSAHGLLHSNRRCSNDREMTLSLTENNDRWRCSLRACRKEVDLRRGTWHDGTQLPFDTIVHFIYWWSKEKTIITFAAEELDVSKNTTVEYNEMLRTVCAESLLADPIMIGRMLYALHFSPPLLQAAQI